MAQINDRIFISLENLSTYNDQMKIFILDLIEKNKVWYGTKEQYEIDSAAGKIHDGQVVIISDEEDDTIDKIKASIGNVESTGYDSLTDYIKAVDESVSLVASTEDIGRLFL